MTELHKLGQKIRFFRKRNGLSQMELENAIEMSPGSISRIENGETNPTKETLEKLRTILGLSSREFRYLNGDLIEPAQESDTNNAITEITEYFNKKGRFAYLIDDRYRILEVTNGFLESFKIDRRFFNENIKYNTLIDLLINPDLKIRQFLENDDYAETLYRVLLRFFHEAAFMFLDEVIIRTLDAINNDKLAKDLWQKIKKSNGKDIHNIEGKKVNFNMYGLSIGMTYTIDSLSTNDRFEIVEYIPTNRLIRLLGNL